MIPDPSPVLAVSVDNNVIPVIAISGGVLIAIISIIFGSVTKMVKTRATEATRREIAAYVAEGSMTAEEGERLLRARGNASASCGNASADRSA